ncbi:MAG: hypothetical protein K1X94_17220 [Sandaracinaceae bacterium]|nr:hypothetical protein [Sandaracinaceae bacterium]
MDDDRDGLVDEGPTGCGEVPNAGEGLCLAGTCVCRDPASTPHAGARADCNADWADGCETALDSESDCGACGVQCDVVSRCVDDPGRGLGCRTAGILDLSVAEPMGEITCVVTVDHQLVCRGPNTDCALSDAEPDDAVLDWTVVDAGLTPDWVRTWSRRRDDGRAVLLVCAHGSMVTTEGTQTEAITCRGDAMSAVFRRDGAPRCRGTAFVGAGTDIQFQGGHWYLLQGWSGNLDRDGSFFASAVTHLEVADMPMAETALSALYSWGPHTGLAAVPATTPVWETPTRVMLAARWVDCRGSYCCAPSVSRNGVFCWRGVGGEYSQGSRAAPASVSVGADGDLTALQLAPTADGSLRACIRVGVEDEDPTTTPRVFCAAAEDVVERGADAVLEEHPELVSAAGRGPRSRVDWQAMCVIEADDWWRCEGAHSGWGGPP